MSTKNDYSEAEWKAISAAPAAAGLLITLADISGPVGIAKEALAVGKAISASPIGDAPEIVKTLAESVKREGGRPELPNVPTSDRTQTTLALIGVVKTAVGAVQRKSPSEIESYKTWLASVAARVSQASKTGSLLGRGGTPLNTDEQQVLEQLADVLAVSASAAVARR
jgi:hypothetical protein